MGRITGHFVFFLALLVGGSGCSSLTLGRKIREPIKAEYSVEDATFRHSIGNLLGAPLIEGNNVVELLNGDAIFADMLKSIHAARRSITFETFIWSKGRIGTMFVDALSERARAGVKVHVIVDAVGSKKLGRRNIAIMKEAGIDFVRYNPPLSPSFFNANHRTHRKLMVVDGKIGYTGGVCLADEWAGTADGKAEPPQWRDSHFRVEGPAVGQIQAAFVDNWLQMRDEVLHGDLYFPTIAPAGTMIAQSFKSGPREGAESARMTYLLSIAAARKSIRISHAYFVPDGLMIDALVDARRRGVEVEVIFPRKIDNIAVKKAGWARLKPLFEAGVEFYEYQPTLYHCKIMIVDDIWSIVGSVNIDERSLRINDESNLNVLDRAFAAQLVKTFEDDKRQSRALTKEHFASRNVVTRFFDHFAGFFRSQL